MPSITEECATVKIKVQETSQPLSIMPTSNLKKLFPDVDLNPTV